MITKQERIGIAIKNAEIGVVRPRQSGGQNCGLISRDIYIRSEETDFYIEVGIHRSQLKNKELAFTLFKLYLDEVIKD